jgi:hypothetical protein
MVAAALDTAAQAVSFIGFAESIGTVLPIAEFLEAYDR